MRSCVSRTARISRRTWSIAVGGGGVASRRAAGASADVGGGSVEFAGAGGADGRGVTETGGRGRGAGTVGAMVSFPRPDGRVGAGGADGAGGASGGSIDWPPCERRAADFVISRDPHPGHVMMASGLASGAMGLLQRGQFILGRPGASIS